MPLRAVTFDFWSTLVDGNITPDRTAQRLARLHGVLVGAGHATITPEALELAFHRALQLSPERLLPLLRDETASVRCAAWRIAAYCPVVIAPALYDVQGHSGGKAKAPDAGNHTRHHDQEDIDHEHVLVE